MVIFKICAYVYMCVWLMKLSSTLGKGVDQNTDGETLTDGLGS